MSRLFAVLFVVLTTLAAIPAHAADDPLKQLAWLSGQWAGREGNARTEQHFMKPAGGVMLGMRRSLSTNRGTDTEFIRIVAEPDGSVVYYGQPLGLANVMPFKLVESGPNTATFVNTSIDYPQRIVFNRYGGVMVAALEGPDGHGGVRRFGWTWKRAGDAP